MTKKDEIGRLLSEKPELSYAQVALAVGTSEGYVVKLASRFRRRQGVQAKPAPKRGSKAETRFEELIRGFQEAWKLDRVKATESFFDISLYPYQREALYFDSIRQLWLWSRKAGKSLLFALRSLIVVFLAWPKRLAVMNLGFRQENADLIGEYLEDFLVNSRLAEGLEDLPKSFVRILRHDVIFPGTGSSIRCRTLTKTVRCRGADILHVDEAGLCDDKQDRTLRRSLWPILRIPDSQNVIILASVPGASPEGIFYEAHQHPEIWHVSKVTYKQLPDERIRQDIEKELGETMDQESWNANYLCEWSPVDTTVFPKDYVDWMFGGWETGQEPKPIPVERPLITGDIRTVPEWETTGDYSKQDLSLEEDRESGRADSHRLVA